MDRLKVETDAEVEEVVNLVLVLLDFEVVSLDSSDLQLETDVEMANEVVIVAVVADVFVMEHIVYGYWDVEMANEDVVVAVVVMEYTVYGYWELASDPCSTVVG